MLKGAMRRARRDQATVPLSSQGVDIGLVCAGDGLGGVEAGLVRFRIAFPSRHLRPEACLMFLTTELLLEEGDSLYMKIPMSLTFIILVLLIGENTNAKEQICGNPAVIFCDDFERGTFDQWKHRYNPALHGITSVSTNVFQGQRALEPTYPAGSDGGG
jgi:hypothetical protein